ncbi:MAG: hypothetical protein WCT05_05135 [Lentisphaeria bacterium]
MNTSAEKQFQSRKQLTQSFLHEYQLYCRLLDQAGEDPGEDPDKKNLRSKFGSRQSLAAAAPPDFAGLQSGQIRLLSQPDQMIWVLALRCWGGGIWLVVPFSPFPFPATEEEFLLGGKRTEYLDVLQFWNARTLHALFLRRSWLVDTLTPQELQTAEVLFNASLSGDALPEELLARTALPITAAPDPRLNYKQQSLARFAALDAADLQWTERCAEAAAEPLPEIDLNLLLGDESAPKQKPHFIPDLFSNLPLAAAGRTENSLCWETALTAVTLLNHFFQGKVLKPHDLKAQIAPMDEPGIFFLKERKTTNLLWKLPRGCSRSFADALFFHREKKTLLATGYTVREGEEGFIVLADWCSEEYPKIHAPADISIFLTEPEKI